MLWRCPRCGIKATSSRAVVSDGSLRVLDCCQCGGAMETVTSIAPEPKTCVCWDWTCVDLPTDLCLYVEENGLHHPECPHFVDLRKVGPGDRRPEGPPRDFSRETGAEDPYSHLLHDDLEPGILPSWPHVYAGDDCVYCRMFDRISP
jgi:hypothetical protein